MKAISIHQPYASLTITAGKLVENRVWSTDYRGPLAIHASQTLTRQDREAIADYRRRCRIAGIDLILDTGGIIGIVELVDVVTASDDQWFDGPFGWIFANPKPIKFLRCRGQLGLFEVELTYQ
jgi:hypothetical protein